MSSDEENVITWDELKENKDDTVPSIYLDDSLHMYHSEHLTSSMLIKKVSKVPIPEGCGIKRKRSQSFNGNKNSIKKEFSSILPKHHLATPAIRP